MVTGWSFKSHGCELVAKRVMDTEIKVLSVPNRLADKAQEALLSFSRVKSGENSTIFMDVGLSTSQFRLFIEKILSPSR